MIPIFLDTVGILAVLDEDDQWHAPAAAAYEKIVSGRRPLVTIEPVLFECGNAAARRPYRADVDDLRQRLAMQNCVLELTTEDREFAWQAFRSSAYGNAGIVDCVSFAVLRRLGVTEVFTNDRHFTAAGFAVLF